ncbi:hypothetical protein CHIBITOTORO_00300 [Serratia phage vB_SmaM-ChibiTotoro]|nr:hypothetical protein CHIBITOTORO_00300 [Serratia phage vB_SmaM-ChibiTotoro]
MTAATRPKATIMLSRGDVLVIAGKQYHFLSWKTTNTRGVLQVSVRDPRRPPHDDAIVFTRGADELVTVIA